MNYRFYIFLYFISTIISTPPPSSEPSYEVFAIEPQTQKENNQDSRQVVLSNKVTIEILDDRVTEEHELRIETENLSGNSHYDYYSEGLTLSEEKILNINSNTCHKYKITEEEQEPTECISNLKIEGNNYIFEYNYELHNDEYIIINYNFTITKITKEIMFRQESITLPNIYPDAYCDYICNIPEKYKVLGLKNNVLNKYSDYMYIYQDNCINETKNDIIRLSAKEGYWKGDMSFYINNLSPIANNIILTFPRLYRGGRNKNINYDIIIDEENILKESNLIKDELFLSVELPSNNNDNKIGVNLHTAFSNNLDDEFIFYPSENLLELDKNINKKIYDAVQEIINDENSEYIEFPIYYRIGKFVYNHITYDSSYKGSNLTALEIFEGKKGVSEHYTILYNTMLNVIGIKTIKVYGWVFDKNILWANELTTGHVWTVALINGEYKELDATWDLFEGISAGHILKGFNSEIYSTSVDLDYSITHNIEFTVNLDEEKEDEEINNVKIPNKKIEEGESESILTELTEEKETDKSEEKEEKEEKNESQSKSNENEVDDDDDYDEEFWELLVKNKTKIIANEPENKDGNKSTNINISNSFYIILLLCLL